MTNDYTRAAAGAMAGDTGGVGGAGGAGDGERYLRIDEVARRTNLTKRTLRYYEELNLLEPSQRSEGNYRLYSESDVRILEHIKEMRDLLGLELKEIRELVAAELERARIRERWQKDTDPAWRLEALDAVERVAHRELELLRERLEGLEHMRQTVQERLASYARLRSEMLAECETSPDASTSSGDSDASVGTNGRQ